MSVASFSASDQSDADNYAIQAEWQPIKPLCMELHKDTVVSVLYTPISGSECQEAKDCNLKNPFHVRVTLVFMFSNYAVKSRNKKSFGFLCLRFMRPFNHLPTNFKQPNHTFDLFDCITRKRAVTVTPSISFTIHNLQLAAADFPNILFEKIADSPGFSTDTR